MYLEGLAARRPLPVAARLRVTHECLVGGDEVELGDLSGRVEDSVELAHLLGEGK